MATNDFSVTSSIELPDVQIPDSDALIAFTLYNNGTYEFTEVAFDFTLPIQDLKVNWPGEVGILPVGDFVSGTAVYSLTLEDFNIGIIANTIEIDATSEAGTITKSHTKSLELVLSEDELPSYLQLDELRRKYFNDWDNSWNIYASDKLIVTSDLIDQTFRQYGYTVSERLSTGMLKESLLKEVIAGVVIGLISYQVSIGGLQANSVSQSVGGDFSVSFTLATQRQRSEVKLWNDEKMMLGLPQLAISKTSMIGNRS